MAATCLRHERMAGCWRAHRREHPWNSAIPLRGSDVSIPPLVCSGSVREGGGMMADLDIARWRLRTQHLVWPYAVSAGEAVGSLLAVQAENPSQAAWAVAARSWLTSCASAVSLAAGRC